MDKFTRHFLSFLLMAIACYGGVVIFAQGEKFWYALTSFPLIYVPLLLFLSFLNYLLRYLRWHIYLKALKIHLGFWRSFQIFMAGLTMTITPGKSGEALKAHLLRKEGDNPWSMGLPIVFAERLTDLMSVVLLVALGLNILPLGKGAVILGSVVCIFFLLFFANPTIFQAIVRLLGKLPGMASRSEGTCVALLEAMAGEICPVVSAVGGNPAVLGSTLRHRLVEPEDPLALALAWQAALGDGHGRELDASEARRRIVEEFDLRRTAAEYERIYLSG